MTTQAGFVGQVTDMSVCVKFKKPFKNKQITVFGTAGTSTAITSVLLVGVYGEVRTHDRSDRLPAIPDYSEAKVQARPLGETDYGYASMCHLRQRRYR